MGLVVIIGDGDKSRPALVCDVCQKVIDDWKLANVDYNNWPDKEHWSAVTFSHKECSVAQATRSRYWMPLTQFLPWLLWNNKWGKCGDNKITIDVPKQLF